MERSILAAGDENVKFVDDPGWVGSNPSDTPLSLKFQNDNMFNSNLVPPINLKLKNKLRAKSAHAKNLQHPDEFSSPSFMTLRG